MKSKKQLIDKEILKEIIHIGKMMSNVCANISQESWTVSDRDRENMRMLYQQWDKINLNNLRS